MHGYLDSASWAPAVTGRWVLPPGPSCVLRFARARAGVGWPMRTRANSFRHASKCTARDARMPPSPSPRDLRVPDPQAHHTEAMRSPDAPQWASWTSGSAGALSTLNQIQAEQSANSVPYGSVRAYRAVRFFFGPRTGVKPFLGWTLGGGASIRFDPQPPCGRRGQSNERGTSLKANKATRPPPGRNQCTFSSGLWPPRRLIAEDVQG